MKKIKKILTAIGNPILNNELKKINEITVINNDILYQDGIFEILEINKEIDFIIISQLIPGNLELEDLVEKIEKINSNIKIILILENYNDNLENTLVKKGVYRIFYDNKIEIKDIIKIINEDNKMEKYNEEIRKEIDELKEYIRNNNYQDQKYIDNKIKKSEKNVRIKDEETLLLGGMIQQTETTGTGKIPLLGDIPIIGFFFRNQNKNIKREELLIMMTPRIIKDTEDVADL